MAILKCKMCGGDLNIEEGLTVVECEYCSTKQTVPTIDNEKKAKLFDRANRLRMDCQFDKAATVYESIIEEFDTEAEGYWGNLLCKFGIEYVDDPATGNKIPTCHRSSFDSFMDDPDFEMVMENSDTMSRNVYREQAKQIEEIRKGIIEVSGKEEPYDIFICYKETAEDGQRTLDSVLAQDVYDVLTGKGYRVFFSRVTLEDKLGTEYEPYIFAALNSAKIMLVFGTSYDYFNAVWVKNEWSRYLKLMAKNKEKYLIPCYKDIDAYDIPKEFAKLQAQDLGKVGATQDLVRGIEKILGGKKEEQKETVVIESGNTSNAAALLRRGYDSLEDGYFEDAGTYFDKALNIDAQSAEAYLGLFMVEIKASNQLVAKSIYVKGDYVENRYWKRAKQYASKTLAETLNNWDSLRMNRKDEETRRAKEEALRAQEEERSAIEEEKKKIFREIGPLLNQLRTDNFEMTVEEQAEQERLNADAILKEKLVQNVEYPDTKEVSKIEGLIASKKTQLDGLGVFKGKEKKELQSQIGVLENTLSETKKKVSERQSEISRLKKRAEYAKAQANEYSNKVKNSKKEQFREQICKYFGIIFNGNKVNFGSYEPYEQGTGKKPIEWQVLEKTEKGIFIITRQSIEIECYNDYFETKENKGVTWEGCYLRKWLNNDFLKMAFDITQRTIVADTRCPADRNPKYDINPGNETIDKIFSLSITEAEKYFKSNEDRHVIRSLRECDTDSFCDHAWWLRSPGCSGDRAAFVNCDGSIEYSGDGVDDMISVRPAMWINLPL